MNFPEVNVVTWHLNLGFKARPPELSSVLSEEPLYMKKKPSPTRPHMFLTSDEEGESCHSFLHENPLYIRESVAAFSFSSN